MHGAAEIFHTNILRYSSTGLPWNAGKNKTEKCIFHPQNCAVSQELCIHHEVNPNTPPVEFVRTYPAESCSAPRLQLFETQSGHGNRVKLPRARPGEKGSRGAATDTGSGGSAPTRREGMLSKAESAADAESQATRARCRQNAIVVPRVPFEARYVSS